MAIAATVADFRREPVLDSERQDFVTLAEAAIEQQLPGLESSLWLAVTAEGERYILAATDVLWAICPAEDLR